MSKAPTPNEITDLGNSETIELENQNQKYKLVISNNSKIIQFYIENLTSFPKKEYNNSFNLEELQKINRFFLFFQNIEETSKILIDFSKKKNLNIIQENNKCKINIINQINGEEFSFEIPKIQKDIKQEIESFIPLMLELKNKIELLEKDNLNLKQKNENLEKKIINVENKNNELEKRIELLEKKNENNEKKTNNQLIKSNIINIQEEKIILNWIPNRLKSTELIYDTSIGGDTINDFKRKCNGQFPTLVIVKTNLGLIFGGYATSAWKEGGPIKDYNSFIFSLQPDKKYNVTNPENALFGYRYNDIMFQFGCCGFRISDNCTKNNNNYISGTHYETGVRDLIKGDGHFWVQRLEIFKINY